MEFDDDDEPPELIPVENPAAEDPLIPQAQLQFPLPFQSQPFAPITGKLNAVRPPPPAYFLAPFPSPPFAPRGIGKLPLVRPPLHLHVAPPVLDGGAAQPEEIEEVAVLAAADDPNPNPPDPLVQDSVLVPFPSPAFAPSVGKMNAVRPPLQVNNEPQVDEAGEAPPAATVNLEAVVVSPNDVVAEADSSEAGPTLNDAVLPHLAVDAGPTSSNDAVPPLTPPFVRRLYQFLMSAMDDPILPSAMAWIDDFTFQVFEPEAVATFFGLEFWEFENQCQKYGMVRIGDNVWRHLQGHLRRGTPEMLQAIQP